MKKIITSLAESIIDSASALGVEAEGIGDASIAGAECVIHLRDAQRAMRAAADALTLAIAQRGDRPADEKGLFKGKA